MFNHREDHIVIGQEINTIKGRVRELEKHRTECDVMHDQHKEHKKRSDDAMNNLTESNMMLAKSITEMNVTLTKVVGIIDRDEPDIKVVRNARIAWGVNKWLFLTSVSIASGAAIIITFYKDFIAWLKTTIM